MKSFEYVSPKTVEEVIAQLSPDWGRSEIMAGGTDLVRASNRVSLSQKRLLVYGRWRRCMVSPFLMNPSSSVRRRP